MLAVNDDTLVAGDLTLEAARDRVVLQQVSEGLVVIRSFTATSLMSAPCSWRRGRGSYGRCGSKLMRGAWSLFPARAPSQARFRCNRACGLPLQVSAVPALPNLHPKATWLSHPNLEIRTWGTRLNWDRT